MEQTPMLIEGDILYMRSRYHGIKKYMVVRVTPQRAHCTIDGDPMGSTNVVLRIGEKRHYEGEPYYSYAPVGDYRSLQSPYPKIEAEYRVQCLKSDAMQHIDMIGRKVDAAVLPVLLRLNKALLKAQEAFDDFNQSADNISQTKQP